MIARYNSQTPPWPYPPESAIIPLVEGLTPLNELYEQNFRITNEQFGAENTDVRAILAAAATALQFYERLIQPHIGTLSAQYSQDIFLQA